MLSISRGLFRDYEPSCGPSFEALSPAQPTHTTPYHRTLHTVRNISMVEWLRVDTSTVLFVVVSIVSIVCYYCYQNGYYWKEQKDLPAPVTTN